MCTRPCIRTPSRSSRYCFSLSPPPSRFRPPVLFRPFLSLFLSLSFSLSFSLLFPSHLQNLSLSLTSRLSLCCSQFSPKHFEKRPVLEWSLAKLTDVKVTDRYSHGALDATHEHPLLLLTGECLDRSDNETAESKVALVGLDNPYAWSKAINYARKHVEYTQPYEPKSEYAQGYWGS